VKTGYGAAHNVRITWDNLYVDKERALDSEIVGSVAGEMPSWQTEWYGVALVIGAGCDGGECEDGPRVIASKANNHFSRSKYLTVALYDEDATYDRIEVLTKILSVIKTTRKQFVFLFNGHGIHREGEILRGLNTVGGPIWPWQLNGFLEYLSKDTIFILILQSCFSGTFAEQFKNELINWGRHSRYIILSCTTGDGFCEGIGACVPSLGCVYEDFMSFFISEISIGYSVKDAFEKVERKIKLTGQTPKALVGNVDWDNVYLTLISQVYGLGA
jgi:hypothetical protein